MVVKKYTTILRLVYNTRPVFRIPKNLYSTLPYSDLGMCIPNLNKYFRAEIDISYFF